MGFGDPPGRNFRFWRFAPLVRAFGLDFAVLTGVLIGWLAYSKDIISHDAVARRFSALHRLIVNKYYIDEVYQWVIDHMVMVFSRFVAFFDRVVVNDTLVNGTAWSVMLSALRLRLIQTGRMPNYGLAMALGVLGLALIWWVVQT